VTTASLAPVTFADRWAEAVAARGSEPFLVFLGSDGRTTAWSYAAFDDLVARVAGRCAALGVARGAAVHLVLRSSPAFVAAWLAVARLGAWMAPSDPGTLVAGLADQVRRTRPVVGICGLGREAAYREAIALATGDHGGPEVVVADEDDPAPAELLGDPAHAAEAAGPGPRPEDRLAVLFTPDPAEPAAASDDPANPASDGPVAPADPDPAEPAAASAARGVELTQGHYAFAGAVMAAAAAVRPDDRHLVVLPLHTANAQAYSFAAAITAGASVALVHGFSASGFLVQAKVLQATGASLLADSIRAILASGANPVEGLQLRHCWYAPWGGLTADEHQRFAGLVGCRPRLAHGTTETLAAVVADRPLAPHPDRVPEPVLGYEVQLRDDQLQVRGVPGRTLFAGYLDDPVATRASTERLPDGSGWFTTGPRPPRPSRTRPGRG
jgi:crotonobetaine/carnitine-CoA ligase